MEKNTRPIALVGLMGAGKSAVATALARRLDGEAADVDALVESRAGASVAELFAREGEPSFRRRESRGLAEALEAGAAVVATGGGIVLDPANRELLKARCRVVWLEVTPEEAAHRLGSDAQARPLLSPGPVVERLAALLRQRSPLYEEVADLRVVTSGRSENEVAEEIFAAFRPGEVGAP